MPSPFTEIGKYQVVDRLGQGGMGTLYLARDPMLERLVAIKVLRVDVDAGDIHERFAREARSVSRLRHPNIVTIFEYGDHKGQPYIVMEYISGESMAEVIRRRASLSIARKLQMMDELCAGLAYAHRARIVHRDIKPANLMLDEESGALKILDFGIARSLESSTTRFTHVVGTPSYMSPEQASGRFVDQRTDIFSIGCVFYELLSYRRAFDGESPMAVMDKIANVDPSPLAPLVRGLDPAIIAVIDKALQRDPANRYQDLETLRADIGRAQRHGQMLDQPTDVHGQPRLPPPSTPKPSNELEKRRASQIRQHLDAANVALANGHFETVIESCEQVLLLDTTNATALTLLDQARAADEQRQVDDLVQRARGYLNDHALAQAEDALAEALKLHPTDPGVLALRRDLQDAHREEERVRHRTAAVDQAIGRARACLKEGAFESAARAASEALAYAPDSAEARALKKRALEEIVRRQQDDVNGRAGEAIAAARRQFDRGERAAAVASLEQFEPAHTAVQAVVVALRSEMAAIAAQQRAEAERQRHEEDEQRRREREQREPVAEPHTVVLNGIGRAPVARAPWLPVVSRWRPVALGAGVLAIMLVAGYAVLTRSSRAPTTPPSRVDGPAIPERDPSPAGGGTDAAGAPPAPVPAQSQTPSPDPSRDADPRIAAARAAYQQRQFAEAMRIYQQLIAAQPDNAVAAAGLNSARAALERQQRTVADFITKGDALRADRLYEGAIRSYEAALVVDPANSAALQKLNDTKLAKQRADAAASEILGKRSAPPSSMAPETRARMLAQANALLDARLFDAAIAAFDDILKGNPADTDALAGREKAVTLKGRPKSQ